MKLALAFALALLSAPVMAADEHAGHAAAPASDATAAYMKTMGDMHGPMMEGMKDADPDVAFVKGMIPHHQGAIDMANVVLKYGKDPYVKQWAQQIIATQAAEIDQMKAWLQAHEAK